MNLLTPTPQRSTVTADVLDQFARAFTQVDEGRLNRAVALVHDGHCERLATMGLFLVRSASRTNHAHQVDAFGCSCEDFAKRGGMCMHRIARSLFLLAERAEVDAEQAEGCIDCEDGGRESPEGMRRRCSNCPLTTTWTDADRERGFQTATVRVDPEDSILDLWPVSDGEQPDLTPQCPRCHAEPRSTRHCDGLGLACISAELFGEEV